VGSGSRTRRAGPWTAGPRPGSGASGGGPFAIAGRRASWSPRTRARPVTPSGGLPGRRTRGRRDGRSDRRTGPRPDEVPGRLAMWRATIRGLLAHKLRLGLTALAIVLGVAFVAGTFILTDTMGRAFGNLFAPGKPGVAV